MRRNQRGRREGSQTLGRGADLQCAVPDFSYGNVRSVVSEMKDDEKSCLKKVKNKQTTKGL